MEKEIPETDQTRWRLRATYSIEKLQTSQLILIYALLLNIYRFIGEQTTISMP